MATRKIAIACQGGGTHAAFTWGVLREILQTKQRWDANSDDRETIALVAISGTSAGALCALATWYGLTPNQADAECGTLAKAIERLDFLWTTFAARTPIECSHNALVQHCLKLKEQGVPFAATSPYAGVHQWGLASLEQLGARPEYLQFARLLAVLCPHFECVDWPRAAERRFRILVAAIEVLSGNFELFDSEKTLHDLRLPTIAEQIDHTSQSRWQMWRPLSLEGVAASGTLPDLLPAQRIADLEFPTCRPGETIRRDGYYWDGLYSQNPPVRDFLDARERDQKPDEVWVIRINPQECPPRDLHVGLEDIRDRTNDLAGNLSLNQELDHILTMNRWIRAYGDAHPPLNNCKYVEVRTIKMRKQTAWELCLSSKFDRSLSHLTRLRDEGQAVAREWLEQWRTEGRDFAAYPDDARYVESRD